MIQIIHGKKGSGKTKKILDMAIQSVKTTTGDVVFVDDDARYMYDLPHEVRFVIASEYGVNSPDMCLGFLSGMLTQNFDISIVFVDAFMKLVKVPAEELESFFSRLEAISEAHHVDFVISASVDDAVAPDFLRKYFI
ncbi:MAG: twitching motility protein PilT [Clostridia bacterium]|nr:twitching motility protein PilT [Clostridia bacterium]MBQ6232912.1 twitching motility protein PilT [Clostridia bacterium]